jgi:hypothetical protein
VVLPVFSDTLEEDAAAFESYGRISSLLERFRLDNFWIGDEGETLLLSAQGEIPAEKILLKGLGATGSCTLEKLARGLEEVGDSLQKMAVRDFGIRIPPPERMNVGYTPMLETACRRLLKPFMVRHREETGLLVRVIVALDVALDQTSPAVRLLETYFKPLLRCSIGAGERIDPALAP